MVLRHQFPSLHSRAQVPTASQTQNGVGTPSNIGADPPGDGALTVDFSSTVFDQLSSDLQEILGVKGECLKLQGRPLGLQSNNT